MGVAESPGNPRIECVTLGPFETNCYVVRVPGRQACWIVDAGFEPHELIQSVTRMHLRPQALVLTHAHVDHIAGIAEVVRAFPGLPVWVHQEEAQWLSDPERNLSAALGLPISLPAPDRTLQGGESLQLEETAWVVLHTPGHSPGGISLYHAPSAQALVGDALFAGSIGRTDFPGSDSETLAQSIRARLYTLPDAVRIFPGHGPSTTIGHEKRTNPFVRA